jgi:hypothetical protein
MLDSIGFTTAFGTGVFVKSRSSFWIRRDEDIFSSDLKGLVGGHWIDDWRFLGDSEQSFRFFQNSSQRQNAATSKYLPSLFVHSNREHSKQGLS